MFLSMCYRLKSKLPYVIGYQQVLPAFEKYPQVSRMLIKIKEDTSLKHGVNGLRR